MKAQLVKRQDRWDLYAEDGSKIGSSAPNPMNKLSIKNCQAIELGYDLNELAREVCNITDPLRLDSQKYKQDPYFKIGFVKGFQKALEILGDKNFSVEDIQNVIDSNNDSLVYQTVSENGDISFCLDEDVLIQSLQQTEWDVEVCCYVDNIDGWLDADSFNSPHITSTGIPKLDSDGCLILKRVQ